VKAFESTVAHLSEGNYAFIVHGGTIMAVMEYFTNGSYYDYQVRNGKGFILNADGSYEVL
jgi:broad specificity phosphatase PhoE